jgi:UDP-N-acetylmuramate dehydrogenase
MKVKKNHSLKNYNSFGVDVKTKYFAEIKSVEELKEILKKYPNERILILGGGSNTLLVDDWNGLTLKVELLGTEKIKENDKEVYIKAYAGENWDDFVRYTVKNNWAGIENMVMVPGTVGGAVRENIACYGHNISTSIQSVEVINLETLESEELAKEECGYTYRDSKFKKEWKEKYLITSATFKLEKNSKEFELSYHERGGRYGSLAGELESFAKEPYSIHDVMEAVIRQRTKRLPSVEEFGTCGSFFKNPHIPFKKYKELAEKVEDLQFYPIEDLKYDTNNTGEFADDDYVKIPAGRILDELGWKGKWEGNVGVSEKHALCVVSNKEATGKEIYTFIKKMQEDVRKEYGIELEPEVNIIKN